MSTAVVFAQAVDTSGATGLGISSRVLPWVGTTFHARVDANDAGLSLGFDRLVALVLVFLLIAAPWRLLRRRAL